MSAQPIPTPRTDAELARLLSDFDLTNIDRREAMAEWARGLEVETERLADRNVRLFAAIVQLWDMARNETTTRQMLRERIQSILLNHTE